MKDIAIALCKDESDKFNITAGKYYMIQDDSFSSLDGETYFWVYNDNKVSVNVKTNRFGGMVKVSPEKWSQLNK